MTIFFPGFPIRQAFDRLSLVLGGEVGVPLGHRCGLVAEDLPDGSYRHAPHGHVGGCRVQVVEVPDREGGDHAD